MSVEILWSENTCTLPPQRVSFWVPGLKAVTGYKDAGSNPFVGAYGGATVIRGLLLCIGLSEFSYLALLLGSARGTGVLHGMVVSVRDL